MIVIIDYGMGNLGSIANMLKKIGAKAIISSDLSAIERANKLILPGVGAFDHGMKNLSAMGVIPLLNRKVFEESVPILGVCLGMHLLTQHSEEGDLPGLGWIEAETIRFSDNGSEKKLRIPHMGWNYVDINQAHPIFNNMVEQSRFYFVHSYHVVCKNEGNILATSRYGQEFTSAVVKDNIIGMQFHPEKSHKYGMKLYQNFVELI